MKRIFCAVSACVLSACGTIPTIPQSIGETNSGFTYIPLDPLPVKVEPRRDCQPETYSPNKLLKDGYRLRAVLDSLPDNAVRMAVKEYDSTGKLSFGVGSVGLKGKRYQVVLDYINADTSNIRFYIKLKSTMKDGVAFLEIEEVTRTGLKYEPIAENDKSEKRDRAEGNIVIPVYVGVGLRLTADLQVLRGNVNLSSLGAIAAEVEEGKASGSLVVQTLGVTGKQVSTSLPLPSELNQTTVQNAILSLGSIKAIIYDEKNTVITPRVTGIYLPIRNATEDLVNNIVSELAREAIPWNQPCEKVPAEEKKPS